jgi:hypothetical protein
VPLGPGFGVLQFYCDEAGNPVETDACTPNREVWNPALQLPRAPQPHRCLGCGTLFTALPGGDASCPNCPHPYLACPAHDIGAPCARPEIPSMAP